MRTSFLLPARNAQATLREALQDVLAQQGADFEVVCVDDASTDGTPRILAATPGIRVVRGDARGLVAALNLGLQHCRGEFIARMDADDRCAPDRLRKQLDLLQSDARLGAVGSLVRCVPESPGLSRLEAWLNSVVTPAQCANARFIEAPLVHPSTTFRRAALGEGWQDHGWAEDWDCLLRLVEQGWQLAKVPEVLVEWRDSDRRLTRTAPAYAYEQMFRLRAHYLARGPLRDREFDIWGAGPSGKRLARELEALGRSPRRFFDVDRQKRIARGKPVLHDPDPPDGAVILCAVGVPSARDEIRAALDPLGHREGTDYFFAA